VGDTARYFNLCREVIIFALMSAGKINELKLKAGKVTVIVLVAVYTLFSVGIIKATHFCMGREASVTFFSSETKKCPCSRFAAERNNCCDDSHELVKIDNEQKVISIFSLVLPVWFELEKLYTAQLVAAVRSSSGPAYAVTDPLPPKAPRFKIYCSFIFYDDGLMG
jgi:hypothetical protein